MNNEEQDTPTSPQHRHQPPNQHPQPRPSRRCHQRQPKPRWRSSRNHRPKRLTSSARPCCLKIAAQAQPGHARRAPIARPKFPDADLAVRAKGIRRPPYKVDILLVNPPTPDRAIWIRSQHRVGRRSRENMIWPQMELAQMAAMLTPDYKVEIIDANAQRMSWPDFEEAEGTAPAFLSDTGDRADADQRHVWRFLARSLGAITIGFGTHVTPMPRETLEQFPALDFVLRGEPELTLRELMDTIMAANGEWNAQDGKLVKADGKPADENGHF